MVLRFRGEILLARRLWPLFALCTLALTTHARSQDTRLFRSPAYGYSFSSPFPVRPIAVPRPSATEYLAVTIDQKADPIYFCAESNDNGWSSDDLFERWRVAPPSLGAFEFPCGEYPIYARWKKASATVNGSPAVRVTSMRGRYETVCTYVATPRLLLALCLPAENPAAARRQDHRKAYENILSSISGLK